MSLTKRELATLCFLSAMSEDAQIWYVAKGAELAEQFPTTEMRDSILSRHQGSIPKSGHH